MYTKRGDEKSKEKHNPLTLFRERNNSQIILSLNKQSYFKYMYWLWRVNTNRMYR